MNYREKILNYFRQRDRGWVLSLFAAVCLVYLPFLGNPFIFDDLSFFSSTTIAYFTQAPFRLELRWLPYASLSWTYEIFSDALPHFFHMGNVLLHAVNTILLFYLLRQLMLAVLNEYENARVVVFGAWLGAMFFAVSPVAVYAAGYVVERSILMATLFALLMQLAYVRGLLSGKIGWLILSVLAYFLSVFSKEHSVMSLAVLAAVTVLLRGKVQISAISLLLTWVAFFIVALVVVLSTNGVLGKHYEVMATTMFEQQGMSANTTLLHLLSVLTQAGLFFKYMLLWLLPNPSWMSIDMRESFVSSLLVWQGWLGAASFMAYGAFGFWLLLRPGWLGLLGFALLYPWLQFAVEFSTIRVQETFVLYRSYLWMPGMALLIPLLLIKYPGRRTKLVLLSMVLLLVPLAWNRLWVMGDNYRLWNDAALLLPNARVAGADRIFYNRGIAEMAAHKTEEAVADLQIVVALNPQLAPVHNALGSAYINTGRYRDAIAQFDAALALKPDDATAYFGKGLSLKRLHEDKLAMQQMQKSCELKNMVACSIIRGMKGR